MELDGPFRYREDRADLPRGLALHHPLQDFPFLRREPARHAGGAKAPGGAHEVALHMRHDGVEEKEMACGKLLLRIVEPHHGDCLTLLVLEGNGAPVGACAAPAGAAPEERVLERLRRLDGLEMASDLQELLPAPEAVHAFADCARGGLVYRDDAARLQGLLMAQHATAKRHEELELRNRAVQAMRAVRCSGEVVDDSQQRLKIVYRNFQFPHPAPLPLGLRPLPCLCTASCGCIGLLRRSICNELRHSASALWRLVAGDAIAKVY